MASTFGGVPLLDFSYKRPPDGSGFYSSFSEGVARRQRDTQLAQEQQRIKLQQEQEKRLQAALAIQQLAANQDLEMGKLKIEEGLRVREQALRGQRALPGLLDILATTTDWTNLSAMRKYAIEHPEVTFTPVWQDAERKEQAAQTQASYLARVQEQIQGRVDVAAIGAASREAIAKSRIIVTRLPQDPATKAKIHALERNLIEKVQSIYDQTQSLLRPMPMATADQQVAEATEAFNLQLEALVPSAQPAASPAAPAATSDSLLQGLVPPTGSPLAPTTRRRVYTPGQGIK